MRVTQHIIYLGTIMLLSNPVWSAAITNNLNSCQSPVAQSYTTTTHGSTKITGGGATLYTSTNCSGTPTGNSVGFGDNSNAPGAHYSITGPAGIFYYCTSNSLWGGTACAYLNPALTGSLQITGIQTDTTLFLGNGDCITVQCNNDGSFNSWVLQTANNLDL